MTDRAETTRLEPRLVLPDVDAAMSFYQKVFDARPTERFEDQSGRVVHAAMRIGESVFTMTQEVPAWGLEAPQKPSGTAVLLHLTVDDPDETADRMVTLGSKVVIAIEDRPYGKREGRVVDPFGHAWILSKTIEALTEDEIRRRLRA